jgi:hypothetical protein
MVNSRGSDAASGEGSFDSSHRFNHIGDGHYVADVYGDLGSIIQGDEWFLCPEHYFNLANVCNCRRQRDSLGKEEDSEKFEHAIAAPCEA